MLLDPKPSTSKSRLQEVSSSSEEQVELRRKNQKNVELTNAEIISISVSDSDETDVEK